MIKTKWQQILDSPKGCFEYNPNQTFCLHVYWIVRSPSAAKEMLEKGFRPCAEATLRDSPTTITYFFRISRDQRLAQEFKTQIKTISQHPHYQPCFKSIKMGLPKSSLEGKLKVTLKISQYINNPCFISSLFTLFYLSVFPFFVFHSYPQ
jgi:hypothetical protein